MRGGVELKPRRRRRWSEEEGGNGVRSGSPLNIEGVRVFNSWWLVGSAHL